MTKTTSPIKKADDQTANSQKSATPQNMGDLQKILAIKLEQAQKFSGLQKGYQTLSEQLAELNMWEVKFNSDFTNHARITLTDSNRKEWTTSNSVLVSLLLEHLKELFIKKKAELEKQLLAFSVE